MRLKIRRMIYVGIGILMLFGAMCSVSISFTEMNKKPININSGPQLITNYNVNTFKEVPYYED